MYLTYLKFGQDIQGATWNNAQFTDLGTNKLRNTGAKILVTD